VAGLVSFRKSETSYSLVCGLPVGLQLPRSGGHAATLNSRCIASEAQRHCLALIGFEWILGDKWQDRTIGSRATLCSVKEEALSIFGRDGAGG
jgi:hypothetical protein